MQQTPTAIKNKTKQNKTQNKQGTKETKKAKKRKRKRKKKQKQKKKKQAKTTRNGVSREDHGNKDRCGIERKKKMRPRNNMGNPPFCLVLRQLRRRETLTVRARTGPGWPVQQQTRVSRVGVRYFSCKKRRCGGGGGVIISFMHMAVVLRPTDPRIPTKAGWSTSGFHRHGSGGGGGCSKSVVLSGNNSGLTNSICLS